MTLVPGTLASLTALVDHITAHPHLDGIDVYGVFPMRGVRSWDRIEVRLSSDADDAAADLAAWAATLTNPSATAQLVGDGERGHIEGQVDGLLADGSPVSIQSSIPAGLAPVQPGRHPLTLPAAPPADAEGGGSR